MEPTSFRRAFSHLTLMHVRTHTHIDVRMHVLFLLIILQSENTDGKQCELSNVCCYSIFTDYCFGGQHIIKYYILYMYMGSWTVLHGEVTPAELITGNRTLNQIAALEQCWQPGGG